MFGAFKKFGKLGALASSVARAWSPLALWPDGIASPGLWIDPSYPASCFQDSAGTTAMSTVGTVLDSSNPVGLILDRKGGATVKPDPGLHLSQSTSTARPFLSARVNLLTYTEDFSNAAWTKSILTVTDNSVDGPVAGTYGDTLNGIGGYTYQQFTVPQNVDLSLSVYLYAASPITGLRLELVDTSFATIGAPNLPNITTGWNRFTFTRNTGSNTTVRFLIGGNGTVTAVMYAYGAQVNLGSTALPYQRVGADSDYTATGIPFQLYDGVDDGMATASFAAGTLINGMDCMIPVRRDSAAMTVLMYSHAGGDYFGHVQKSSAFVCYQGAGNPTVYVNDVQLSGGTSVTAGTLAAALTVGDWYILEFRGLDLGLWDAFGFGLWNPSFSFNGARGDIMLFESTASTEDKDKARQYLADKYGVTLA